MKKFVKSMKKQNEPGKIKHNHSEKDGKRRI